MGVILMETVDMRQNKKFLKGQPYGNLKNVMFNHINYERGFIELVNFLDDKNQKLLQQFMINILSNPCDFTIAELEEMFQ